MATAMAPAVSNASVRRHQPPEIQALLAKLDGWR
jgi:hypothetical protein